MKREEKGCYSCQFMWLIPSGRERWCRFFLLIILWIFISVAVIIISGIVRLVIGIFLCLQEMSRNKLSHWVNRNGVEASKTVLHLKSSRTYLQLIINICQTLKIMPMYIILIFTIKYIISIISIPKVFGAHYRTMSKDCFHLHRPQAQRTQDNKRTSEEKLWKRQLYTEDNDHLNVSKVISTIQLSSQIMRLPSCCSLFRDNVPPDLRPECAIKLP